MEEKNKHTPQKFKAGEKGFALFWLLFGGFFLRQSVLLWREHPGLGGCASVPLFVSGIIVVCALALLVKDRKAPSQSAGKGVAGAVRETLRTLFPPDVLFMLLLLPLYCALLYVGAGFYPSTALFLFVSMTFFMRKQYRREGKTDRRAFVHTLLKNLLWTGLALLFILAVFGQAFRIVLP